MASPRNGKTSELTVRPESSEIEAQPKAIVRRKRGEITPHLSTMSQNYVNYLQ